MKTLAVELQHNGMTPRAGANLTARERVAAYVELTKPRITVLLVLAMMAGFALGSPVRVNYLRLLHTIIATTLLSSGVAALNQFIERELDALMKRTAARPLPAGKLSVTEALAFGLGLTISAEAYLFWALNPLSALVGAAVIVGYVLLYTPLKTRTPLSTTIGAFPGALPPVLGWAAASGEIGVGAWVMFAIQFFWQFPHFLAIAWMYREDYKQAGILMLPVVEPDGRVTARNIVSYTILLLPVSLLPTFLGFAGRIYFAGALFLGVWFLAASIRAARSKSKLDARKLLLASVLYLPLLLGLMVVNGR
jgi:protoheme IX farnesyltransferase